MKIMKLWGHFSTVNRHRFKVMCLCFKCGLFIQGLTHDLSKYSYEEFIPGVRYYQGYRSPITAERLDKGYSMAWLHHSGRNKHHFEYWYDRDDKTNELICRHMPLNYIIESVIDRISASKVYNGEKYNESFPYDFFMNSSDRFLMGDTNFRRIETLLRYLKENGEAEAISYYRELYTKWKKDHSFDI